MKSPVKYHTCSITFITLLVTNNYIIIYLTDWHQTPDDQVFEVLVPLKIFSKINNNYYCIKAFIYHGSTLKLSSLVLLFVNEVK